MALPSSVPAVNITVDIGTDFTKVYTVKNSDGSAFNLTNYTAVSKLKKFPDSSTVAASFASSITSANSGQITVSIASTLTANLDPGRYYYDIVVTSGIGTISKVYTGMALLNPSISV